MCGICGVVYDDRTREAPREAMEAMTRSLRHRGPDHQTTHIHPGIAFGHCRLRVIDPEGGDQPMSDPESGITVCYNGEIYNFQALREQLTALGATFRTRSDTEVLLWGYRYWGHAVLDRLVGMFAFAAWNEREHTLLLARDRLGKKPLVWARLPDGGLAFASELSSLIALGAVPLQLDLESAASVVSLGYVSGTRTILRGIERVAPGGGIRWKRGGEPEPFTWWSLAEIWQERPADLRPLDEIEVEFRALLETAVRDRLVADVPLGAFLSGGLDSSTIVALMKRHQADVTTFSIGFEEASFDELPYARRVAQQLGATHHDEVVRGDDPALLLEIAAGQDEPFADTSIVPTYVLCRSARQHVTVALSGDGGDELFAGYVTHGADRIKRGLDRMPAPVVQATRALVQRLPDSRRKVNAIYKAKQLLAGLDLPPCDAHAWWRTLTDTAQVARLLPAASLNGTSPSFIPARAAYAEAPGLSPLDRMLFVDFRTYLSDDILVKADRASMQHGLEVRSPFLDHRLVEFCCGLPDDLKMRGLEGKHLLRRIARTLTPRSAITRSKAGFSAPVNHWMIGPWRELAEDALSDDKLGLALDAAEARRLLQAHVSGGRDHGFLLFALMMLGLWLGRVRPRVA